MAIVTSVPAFISGDSLVGHEIVSLHCGLRCCLSYITPVRLFKQVLLFYGLELVNHSVVARFVVVVSLKVGEQGFPGPHIILKVGATLQVLLPCLSIGGLD